MIAQWQKKCVGKSFSRLGFVYFVLLIVISTTDANGGVKSDFDGDGKADISVYRRSDGTWHIAKSSGGFFSVQWGLPNDTPVPADYDGDGKTDIAVYRYGEFSPGNYTDNYFYILRSSDNGFTVKQYGRRGTFDGDSPVSGFDFDGDRKVDFATSISTDYLPAPVRYKLLLSSDGTTLDPVWGFNSDVRVLADYDGDGKTDFAVFRRDNFGTPANQANTWFILNSSNGTIRIVQFGLSSDRQVPADYDGDGKADLAVYRPSNGTWYRINSRDNSFSAVQFGTADDIPTPADYDGDGKTDIAVWRYSDGFWFIQRSTAGFYAQQFGAFSDSPIPR